MNQYLAAALLLHQFSYLIFCSFSKNHLCRCIIVKICHIHPHFRKLIQPLNIRILSFILFSGNIPAYSPVYFLISSVIRQLPLSILPFLLFPECDHHLSCQTQSLRIIPDTEYPADHHLSSLHFITLQSKIQLKIWLIIFSAFRM